MPWSRPIRNGPVPVPLGSTPRMFSRSTIPAIRQPCLALLVVTTTIALSACTGRPQPGGLLRSFRSATITEEQLQAEIDELVIQFVGRVEIGAERIYSSTSDRRIQSNALRWVVSMNHECMRSNFHQDAMSNLLDVAALTAQQLHYFRDGDGQDLFGEYQYIAVETSERLGDLVLATINETLGEDRQQDGRLVFDDYVKANPITGTFGPRKSIEPLAAAVREVAPVDVWSNIKQMERGITNIVSRLEIMTDQLPKQMLWSAELMVDRRFASTLTQVDESLAVIETLPDLIAAEREATLAVITRERELIMQDIDRQRQETLEAIDVMVGETITSVDATVEGAMTQLDKTVATSVAASMKNVDDTTDRALESIDSTVVEAIEHLDRRLGDAMTLQRDAALDRVEIFIDRIFLRIIQLSAIGLIVILLAVVVVRRFVTTGG